MPEGLVQARKLLIATLLSALSHQLHKLLSLLHEVLSQQSICFQAYNVLSVSIAFIEECVSGI